MFNLNKFKNLSFLNKNDIAEVQNKLLRKHISYCFKNSPWYSEKLKEIEKYLNDVSIDTLSELEFTTKNDLSLNNEEFIAVTSDNIADISLTSGITGKVVKIAYTRNDLKRLSYNEYQALSTSGVVSGDRVLLTCTMDRCFVAGLAFYYGVTAIGATAIRNGLSGIDSHSEIIKNLNPNVIIGVPSFLLKLGQVIGENNRKIKKIVCIGESIKDENLELTHLGLNLSKLWSESTLFSSYASTESITTFAECDAHKGGHLISELAVVEIVNEKDEVVKNGGLGEIVITPLQCEGTPLIRYKTGDISFIADSPCSCGRNTIRLGPIIGRKDQMLKIRGTTLFPQHIFSALDGIKGVSNYYLNILDLSKSIVELCVSTSDATLTTENISKILQNKIRVKLDVKIFNEDEILKILYRNNSRKAIRVLTP